MNLIAKDYAAVRSDLDGVLVLSEYAGAAAELTEAGMVNPYDDADMLDCIEYALGMQPDERRKRIQTMQERLRRNDVRTWGKNFLAALSNAVLERRGVVLTRDWNEDYDKELVRCFATAKSTVFCLDYDGTLVPYYTHPDDAVPDPNTLTILENMAKLPNVHVAITSGRPREFLTQHLGELPLDLWAEHGLFYRKFGHDWEQQMSPCEKSVLSDVGAIMELWADRLPGSFVEKKERSRVWHYRRCCEPQAAFNKAQALYCHLRESLRSLPFKVQVGSKVVEVKPLAANKGIALRRMADETGADLMVGVGDDSTDEDMFDAAGHAAYTLKIGEGTTKARFRLQSSPACKAMLWKFVYRGSIILGWYESKNYTVVEENVL